MVEHSSKPLSPQQLVVLRALVDAFLPPLPPPRCTEEQEEVQPLPRRNDSPAITLTRRQREIRQRYYTHRLSADQAFLQHVQQCLEPRHRWALHLLSTPVGTALYGAAPHWLAALTTGFADYAVPDLPTLVHYGMHRRPAIWNDWKVLLCRAALAYTATQTHQLHAGRMHRHLSTLHHHHHYTQRNPLLAALPLENLYDTWFSERHSRHRASHNTTDDDLGMITPDNYDPTNETTCDVIVVGASAAGRTAARTLAEAGYHVVWLEQNAHLPLDRGCDNNNSNDKEDGHLVALQSSTHQPPLWNFAFPQDLARDTPDTIGLGCVLPDDVRQEWAERHGWTDFAQPITAGPGNVTTSPFEASLLHVQQGLHEHTAHVDWRSTFLTDACDALNYPHQCLESQVTRNNHDEKEVTATYPVLVGGARVHKVLTQRHRGSLLKQAMGVEYLSHSAPRGETTRRRLYARHGVILATGALETPCLLQRSGLKSREIGRHLHTHPGTAVIGIVPRQQVSTAATMQGLARLAQDGVSLVTLGQTPDKDDSKMSNADTNIAGNSAAITSTKANILYHALTPHPSLVAIVLPWITPQAFRANLLHIDTMIPILCYLRDTSEGTVRETCGGKVQVDYRLNTKDRSRLLEAIQGGIRLAVAGNATKVFSGHALDPGYTTTKSTSPSNTGLEEYLASIRRRGFRDYQHNLFSLFQMGSCRMATSPHRGVVDSTGEVWECSDLYIMDASIFPTSIGVSPIVTTMALAHMLSLRFVNRLVSQPQTIRNISVRRYLYALQLELQALWQMIVRIISILLVLIPVFLFWWFDLACLLA